MKWRIYAPAKLFGVLSRLQIVTEEGESVCSMYVGKKPGGSKERKAARIIAAAPALLATLDDLNKWLANTGHAADHPWRISINAAIAMARGRCAQCGEALESHALRICYSCRDRESIVEPSEK